MSLSAEKTGESVRKQVEKCRIKWEEIDSDWLTLYIHLNRDLCSNLQEISKYLPERRRGREAGMGSEECMKRHLDVNSDGSNWTFPRVTIDENVKRKLMGAALEVAVKFFFKHFTYTFGGKTYLQIDGGPIGARLTMCVAKLVLQQWKEEYNVILREAQIEEKLSKIYVDDNRCITEYVKAGMRFNEKNKKFEFNEDLVEKDEEVPKLLRTKRELLKAMNSINRDLVFTMEHEDDFEKKRLPTLAFELWSDKTGIRYSYFEKSMRNQILTMKRSSQSENSKFAILTNELRRRFNTVDEKIEDREKIQIVDHFLQQLINSGYSWQQSREVIVSSLKGLLKEEMRRKSSSEKRYRTGEESLETRMKDKLLEATQWYKDKVDKETELDNTPQQKLEGEDRSRTWKEWRRTKRRKKLSEEEKEKKPLEGRKDLIEGVMFVPNTEGSEFAKRLREKLQHFEKFSRIRLKIVERTGEKLVDMLHKSNPWSGERCERKECKSCSSSDEKVWGDCRKRNVVYETECGLCSNVERKEVREKEGGEKEEEMGKKRKRVEKLGSDKLLEKPKVKYIGETSRSSFERFDEHWDDFNNLRIKSHLPKHYVNCHPDKKM